MKQWDFHFWGCFIWDLINHCLRIWCRSMIKISEYQDFKVRYIQKYLLLHGKRLRIFLWLPKWQFMLSEDWLVGNGAIVLWLQWEMQDWHFCLKWCIWNLGNITDWWLCFLSFQLYVFYFPIFIIYLRFINTISLFFICYVSIISIF